MDGLPDTEGITLDYFPCRNAAGGEVLVYVFSCLFFFFFFCSSS